MRKRCDEYSTIGKRWWYRENRTVILYGDFKGFSRSFAGAGERKGACGGKEGRGSPGRRILQPAPGLIPGNKFAFYKIVCYISRHPCTHQTLKLLPSGAGLVVGHDSALLGSARLCSARLGSTRVGSARLYSALLGSNRVGLARLGSHGCVCRHDGQDITLSEFHLRERSD